jgi:hypothetical protein
MLYFNDEERLSFRRDIKPLLFLLQFSHTRYLKFIFLGPCTDSLLIAKVCGNDPITYEEPTGLYILIHFHTDGSVVRNGWKLTYYIGKFLLLLLLFVCFLLLMSRDFLQMVTAHDFKMCFQIKRTCVFIL